MEYNMNNPPSTFALKNCTHMLLYRDQVANLIIITIYAAQAINITLPPLTTPVVNTNKTDRL